MFFKLLFESQNLNSFDLKQIKKYRYDINDAIKYHSRFNFCFRCSEKAENDYVIFGCNHRIHNSCNNDLKIKNCILCS
jgi:hypothetical protein